MFTYSKYNLYRYTYLYLFASSSQKLLSNYIRKDSYYWITIITYSVYLLYVFALFSQKPLLKFIYENELSCNIQQCVSVYVYKQYNLLCIFMCLPRSLKNPYSTISRCNKYNLYC